MMRRILLWAFLVVLLSHPAQAQITTNELERLGSTELKEGAALPHISLQRYGYGRTQLIDDANARPALLILVDYTCATLCGVTLDLLEEVLEQTPLVIGRDYRVLVVGFDPKDSDSAIASFRSAHISPGGLSDGFEFLLGTPDEIASVTRAINFTAVYDRVRDQFAHPTEIIGIASDGRISRWLDSFELTPGAIEHVLTGATEDQGGSILGRLTRICYGWGSAAGIYTPQIRRALLASGAATLVAIFGVIVLLCRKEKRARQGGSNG